MPPMGRRCRSGVLASSGQEPEQLPRYPWLQLYSFVAVRRKSLHFVLSIQRIAWM
jgi:hypothetical protein